MRNAIQNSVDLAVKAIETLNLKSTQNFIERVSLSLAKILDSGNKILIAGNGGSLCDAMHFAEELTGYFRKKRKAFPAIALADPAHMSCVANDTDFESVFSRGVEALGKEGDALVVLSTSGNSPNIIKAVSQAQSDGIVTIAFLGKSGGQLKGMCDFEWIVEGFETSDRIQEAHMTAIHIIIEMIELKLLYSPKQLDERVLAQNTSV
ncbi:MAG: SIS domain-containing protein [Rhabdochlamydiaceae bacterium]|nr:SIS domain-containing protein [Candidatus Amphrikana amoebophyrae]